MGLTLESTIIVEGAKLKRSEGGPITKEFAEKMSENKSWDSLMNHGDTPLQHLIRLNNKIGDCSLNPGLVIYDAETDRYKFECQDCSNRLGTSQCFMSLCSFESHFESKDHVHFVHDEEEEEDDTEVSDFESEEKTTDDVEDSDNDDENTIKRGRTLIECKYCKETYAEDVDHDCVYCVWCKKWMANVGFLEHCKNEHPFRRKNQGDHFRCKATACGYRTPSPKYMEFHLKTMGACVECGCGRVYHYGDKYRKHAIGCPKYSLETKEVYDDRMIECVPPKSKKIKQ